jgi:hypothetical protein
MLGLEEDFELSADQAVPEHLESGGKYTLPTEYLSWSQMNLYMSCGERYRRRYVEKMRTPPSSNLGHGRIIHRVVEEMNIAKMKDGRLMESVEVNDLVSSLKHEYTEDIAVWDPKVPDMETFEVTARELLELYRVNRLPDTRPKAVELRVGAMLDGEVPYMGFVDLLEYNPMSDPPDPINLEGPVPKIDRSDCVSDLKATGKKYGKHRIENAMQLTLYAEVTGVDNVAFDLLVQKKQSEFVRQGGIRTPQEKQHAKNVAKDIAQGISAGYFPKTDPENWMCTPKWCDYYDQCRGGKDPVHVPVLGLEE